MDSKTSTVLANGVKTMGHAFSQTASDLSSGYGRSCNLEDIVVTWLKGLVAVGHDVQGEAFAARTNKELAAACYVDFDLAERFQSYDFFISDLTNAFWAYRDRCEEDPLFGSYPGNVQVS